MISYEIYYNKAYKRSCDLVKETFKGNDLYIDQVNKLLLIDNIAIAKLEDINQIKFLVKGYYQVINIAEPNVIITPTDIEMPKNK